MTSKDSQRLSKRCDTSWCILGVMPELWHCCVYLSLVRIKMRFPDAHTYSPFTRPIQPTFHANGMMRRRVGSYQDDKRWGSGDNNNQWGCTIWWGGGIDHDEAMHEGKEYQRQWRQAVARTASGFIVNRASNVLVDGGDEHGAKASYHRHSMTSQY